jgi:hypothetical protein
MVSGEATDYGTIFYSLISRQLGERVARAMDGLEGERALQPFAEKCSADVYHHLLSRVLSSFSLLDGDLMCFPVMHYLYLNILLKDILRVPMGFHLSIIFLNWESL